MTNIDQQNTTQKLKIKQHEPYWKPGVFSTRTLLKTGCIFNMNPTENRVYFQHEPYWKPGVYST
jgi:hypothetical protein